MPEMAKLAWRIVVIGLLVSFTIVIMTTIVEELVRSELADIDLGSQNKQVMTKNSDRKINKRRREDENDYHTGDIVSLEELIVIVVVEVVIVVFVVAVFVVVEEVLFIRILPTVLFLQLPTERFHRLCLFITGITPQILCTRYQVLCNRC